MQANDPLVTIVIPAYNHGGYLRQTIDSVLNQSYPKIELIVIDDGSTDETRDILKSYGDKFMWESQANQGQSRTLNKGWKMARGEILAYLSADDLLMPDAVKRAVECLVANTEAILSYCDFELIDPESRVIRRVKTPEYSYFQMVTRFICAPSVGAFFLRSAYEKTNGWNPEIHRFPDFDFWLRLGLHGRFVRIPEIHSSFRVHEGSQSFSESTSERAEESIRVIHAFYELKNLPGDVLQAKNQAMGNANLVAAQLHLRAGRYQKALQRIFDALKLGGVSILNIKFARMIFNGFVNRLSHRFLWKIRRILN